MAKMTQAEKDNFLDLFSVHRGSGCVLDFNNERFQHFVFDCIEINVFNKFSTYSSKGKKLMAMMDTLADKEVGKLLLMLLQHMFDKEYVSTTNKGKYDKCVTVANRLIGKIYTVPKIKETIIVDYNLFDYQKHLVAIMALVKTEDTKQKRGYLFQDFLNSFFEDCGFNPRKSFKVNGNQIDGSIEVDNEIYLVEAKWQQLPSGIAELEKFDTVVNKQSGITRGVFISYSGFVEPSIQSFRIGTKPKFFLISGRDIALSLQNKGNFHEIFKRKLRALAEGNMFLKVQ